MTVLQRASHVVIERLPVAGAFEVIGERIRHVLHLLQMLHAEWLLLVERDGLSCFDTCQ